MFIIRRFANVYEGSYETIGYFNTTSDIAAWVRAQIGTDNPSLPEGEWSIIQVGPKKHDDRTLWVDTIAYVTFTGQWIQNRHDIMGFSATVPQTLMVSDLRASGERLVRILGRGL